MNAPDFALPDHDGRVVTLQSLRGKRVVLYFYPKADTPGCTTQACAIRDNASLFHKLGAVVIGISPDDVSDLKKFRAKYNLRFTLLADPDLVAITQYGVWQEKSFMGRRYMGVARTTVLIDTDGTIVKTFDKVNPTTHADVLLHALRELVDTLHSAKKSVKTSENAAFSKSVTKKKGTPPKTSMAKKKTARKTVRKTARKTTKRKTARKTTRKTARKTVKKAARKTTRRKTAAKPAAKRKTTRRKTAAKKKK
jgi:peroxiredoxin Q/BCP